MQKFCTLLCVLSLLAHLSIAENHDTKKFIGSDGKEHQMPINRDGLHDLRNMGHHHRLHIHSFDARHLPHMLNQDPIIVSQRNLHITDHGRHIVRRGFGSGTSTKVDSAALAGHQQYESSTSLSKSSAGRSSQNVRFRGGLSDRKAQAPAAAVAASPSAEGPAPAPMPMSAPSPSKYSPFVMDEDLGAPEQGFLGDVVEHDNMKTMTRDWHGEYGPGADGLQSYYEICALYPENKWCRLRGYHRTTLEPKSGAMAMKPAWTISIMTLLAACGLVMA